MSVLQLAPMQALSDAFFINTYNSIFGGFNQMMMPYLLADSKSPKKKHWLQKHFDKVNAKIDVVPQLLSNDDKEFVRIANILYDIGYKHINLNLGCPFPFVTKKERGAGLLPMPNKIDELLNNSIPKLKPKLSVKVRLGLIDEKEIFSLIDVFNSYPIYQIIIHPRTAVQKYGGKPNKQLFYSILHRFKMPVIYNGDILRKEHVIEIKKHAPTIQGVMIGRGAFINPFITSQINGVELSEKEKIYKYKELYSTLCCYYKQQTQNDMGFLSRMKALWFYFSQSFANGEKYWKMIQKTNDVNVFNTLANSIFDNEKLLY